MALTRLVGQPWLYPCYSFRITQVVGGKRSYRSLTCMTLHSPAKCCHQRYNLFLPFFLLPVRFGIFHWFRERPNDHVRFWNIGFTSFLHCTFCSFSWQHKISSIAPIHISATHDRRKAVDSSESPHCRFLQQGTQFQILSRVEIQTL